MEFSVPTALQGRADAGTLYVPTGKMPVLLSIKTTLFELTSV